VLTVITPLELATLQATGLVDATAIGLQRCRVVRKIEKDLLEKLEERVRPHVRHRTFKFKPLPRLANEDAAT